MTDPTDDDVVTVACDACRTVECPYRNGPSYCDECGPLVDEHDEVVAGNVTNLRRAARLLAQATTLVANAATHLGAVDAEVSALLGAEEAAVGFIALECQAGTRWADAQAVAVLDRAKGVSP